MFYFYFWANLRFSRDMFSFTLKNTFSRIFQSILLEGLLKRQKKMKELETNSKTKKNSDFFDIKNGNIEISWHFQPFRMLKKKKGNLSGIAYGQKVLGEVS